MSIEPFYMLRMTAYEVAELKDLEAEQVTHHTEEYAVGSERYEKLMGQLEQANRFQSPDHLSFNV